MATKRATAKKMEQPAAIETPASASAVAVDPPAAPVDPIDDLQHQEQALLAQLGAVRAALTAAGAPPPPRLADKQAASAALEKMADLNAHVAAQTAAANAQIARINDKLEEDVAGLIAEIDELTASLEQFAIENAALFKGKKSLTLPGGTIGWKSQPPKVELTDQEAFLAYIDSIGETKVFTVQTSAMSNAALKERLHEVRKMPGIQVTEPGDRFSASPRPKVAQSACGVA